MPVVPRKGPHPFAKPLVIFGVKRPPSSANTSPEPKAPETALVDDTEAADPASPSPSESKPSWLDGPYGPAAEERIDARSEWVRQGGLSRESLRKLMNEAKPKA